MPGRSLKKDELVSVTLKVSKGQEYVEVPDIVGKGISEAEMVLKELGIQYELVPVYDSSLKKGVITSMDHKVGDKIVKSKEKIFLNVRSERVKEGSQVTAGPTAQTTSTAPATPNMRYYTTDSEE